ncbi:hypothetical protein U471_35340 [Bacillus amyloliquefaciens CC178]|nr:hypothetical protein U471_35340 [Bacillus amyloliquefaciens CC178]
MGFDSTSSYGQGQANMTSFWTESLFHFSREKRILFWKSEHNNDDKP